MRLVRLRKRGDSQVTQKIKKKCSSLFWLCAEDVMRWSSDMLLQKRIQVILASLVLAIGTMPIQAAETGGEAGSAGSGTGAGAGAGAGAAGAAAGGIGLATVGLVVAGGLLVAVAADQLDDDKKVPADAADDSADDDSTSSTTSTTATTATTSTTATSATSGT